MNTGIQDAANLGWKLAAALRGGPDLLDTYHDERHPVGAAVIRGSARMLRNNRRRLGPLSVVRNAVAGTAMHVPPISRRITFAISGLWVSYQAPAGSHRSVGKRIPDIALEAGSLYQALRGGRFVLVGGVGAVDGWAGRVDAVQARDPKAAIALVRPDGYVAWSAGRDSSDPQALRSALAAWCGDPS